MIPTFALFFLTSASAFAQAEHRTSDWWKGFEEVSSGKAKVLDIYNKCLAKDDKTVCRGIFGPHCVKGSYCDNIFRVTEHPHEFDFESFNLESSYGQDKLWNKDMGYMIAIAPFQPVGDNLTAKCKSELTLKDFKFFVYKLNVVRWLPTRARTETINWDYIQNLGFNTSAATISKKLLPKSCQLRLAERNHYINKYKAGGMPVPSNALMKIEDELMFVIHLEFFYSYGDEDEMIL